MTPRTWCGLRWLYLSYLILLAPFYWAGRVLGVMK
jgi:hypothetical protein